MALIGPGHILCGAALIRQQRDRARPGFATPVTLAPRLMRGGLPGTRGSDVRVAMAWKRRCLVYNPVPSAPVAVLSALVALSLLVILLALSWRALDGMCGSTEITRLPAPDGRHDAVLFEHNCGATTDFATHVSVLPAGAPLGDAPGNAFAAEAGEVGDRAPWGGPPVEVTWDADGALVIRYDPGADVFQSSATVGGIEIRVLPKP